MKLNLNLNGLRRCGDLIRRANELRIAVTTDGTNATLIDCGIHAGGGLEAGRIVAEVCLAGLGKVELAPGRPDLGPGPDVVVRPLYRAPRDALPLCAHAQSGLRGAPARP